MKMAKKFLYLNLIIAFFSLISINSLEAATRLTPNHLYYWAKEGNLSRLQQFQRYINLQDQDHNTALCIAQQNKDRNAYALLLQFGASTKVSCHDDNDQVCAVIAGEKWKVSPAAWLLLGAGAAAGAYALLDHDSGHKHKRCPVGYEKGRKDCSDKTDPSQWEYVSSGYIDDIPCGKCVPLFCPTDYSTDYQSASDCGTSGSNGWEYTTSGSVHGQNCGKCTPYECTRYDDGKGVRDVTQCPTYTSLQEAVDTNAIGWAGDEPCYRCTYTCKNSAGYYDDEDDCLTAHEGYTCKSVTENNITCWFPDTPAACPAGYDTSIQSVDNCGTTKGQGYTYTSSGSSGGQSCGKCIPNTCNSPYTFSSVSACGDSGSNGWSWTQDTVTPYAGETACGKCEAFQCSKYDTDEGKGVSDVTDCPVYSGLQESVDTNAIGWAGDTACYRCTYTCKNSAGYFDDETTCLDNNEGYTCQSVTEHGVTCWIKNNPAACPAGYDTSIQSVDNCGTTKGQGYTYTSSGTSGGQSCGKCVAKTCDLYDDGKGVSVVGQCTAYISLKATLSATEIGWAGETGCYKCNYSCNTDNNYHSTEQLCLDANEGYTCTSSTENSVTCWTKNDPAACPAGYDTAIQSVDNCGTTKGKGYTYTSSGTSGGQSCGKCIPNTCNSPYTFSSVSACGNKGSNGWTWTQDTVIEYAGETPCGKCDRLPCPDTTTGPSVTDLGTCPTHSGYTISVDANIVGWYGETACLQCTYTCNSNEHYYDEDEEETCVEFEGESCSPVTEYGITCYVPDSHISSVQNFNMTLINTSKINITSSGDEDIVAINTNTDFENKTDETTGSVGEINITHNSTGQAIGVLNSGTNTTYNRAGASINIANNNGGDAIGIYAEQGGSVVNEGTIKITGENGTATGIYGEGNNTITNAEGGVIDVSGTNTYGIYVKDGSDTYITNAGTIYAQGSNAHGIYVDENSNNATVVNTGKIYLNGTESGDAGITLNGGTLHNMNLLYFNGSADLNAMNGVFFLEDGGVYEAQSLSGDLNIGVSNVLGGNQDVYVNEGALQSDNIDDLNVTSESAMFTAHTVANNDGNGNDVVLERRDFAEFAPNASVAQYLENNYRAGNLEAMYDNIKLQSSMPNVSVQIAQDLGYDVLPNFAEENYTALKSLNRVITDNILTPTDEINRIVAGADYINYDTDNKGLLVGYELNASSIYTYGDKRLDNRNRLGLGLSITKIKTDYDGDGDRKLDVFNLFIPYMHKFTDNLRWASILSVGYGNGEYDRGKNRESDISDIFYGWNNELRYTMDLNGFAELEPAIMLNALGYTEDGFDEGTAATDLKSKRTENMSVESGIGLFLKKNISLYQYGKLGFKIGGAYYRELADQYDDLKIKNRGATGWSKINDYAHIYNRNRGLFEAAIDYEFKKLSIYAKYNQLIQRDDPKLLDLGLKYNF